MNKSAYYLYNNVAITAGSIVAMLKSTQSIELARVALFLPLLLDDNIVKKINEKNEYSFDNIVSLNILNIRWVLSIPFFISCIRQQNPLTVLSKIILRKVKQFNLPPQKK